jgi:hypothetical protein
MTQDYLNCSYNLASSHYNIAKIKLYYTIYIYILVQGSPNFFIQGPQKISNALSGPKVY